MQQASLQAADSSGMLLPPKSHGFFGVFDGHGPCGEEIARSVQESLLGDLRKLHPVPADRWSDEARWAWFRISENGSFLLAFFLSREYRAVI